MKLALVAVLAALCATMTNGVPYYGSYCNGINEVFSNCGCPSTCDNWRLGPQWCGRSCQRGCFCRSGFVRNSHGLCIEPAQCSRTSVEIQESVASRPAVGYSFGYAPGLYGLGLGYGYGYDNLLPAVVY
ncbi:cysteine-rich venom protein 6-like [Wyeomyia smithii]|uniref:cysteine-rich venom protein 6-like n=1 Tax=Wyeomyia smithii TaxID=174621 RepID=UPI0024681C62|nr:cysteine-rich venom protein 6-like [Wyeomyia smithii]